MFDEVHYVPDAKSILDRGYEVDWFKEERNKALRNLFPIFESLEPNSTEYLSSHPPLGKMFIALGMSMFEHTDTIGWRLSSVIAGALTAVFVMVLAQQIFKNRKLSLTAGVFTVFSNFNAGMSSIAILDIFLGLFVLISVIFAVAYLKRLPKSITLKTPYLMLSAIFFGLSMSIKWSTIYFIILFIIIILAAEIVKYYPKTEALKQKIVSIFKILSKNVIIGIIMILAYIPAWIPHLIYYRIPKEQSVIGGLKSLYEWHFQTIKALEAITSPHNFASHAYEWLWLANPNRFITAELTDGTVVAVDNIPNLILAFISFIAIIVLAVYSVKSKQWIPLILPASVLAGWVPWLFYNDRTIFFFYVAIFEPYLIIAAAWIIFQMRMLILRYFLIGSIVIYGAWQMPISVGHPVKIDSPLYNFHTSWQENMIRAGLVDTDQLPDAYYNSLYERGIITEPRESSSENTSTTENSPNRHQKLYVK